MSYDQLSAKSSNTSRLQGEIETLATFIDHEKPGWTRRPFTKEYKQARTWLCERMEDIGLSTHVDAVSNLIGRLEGRCSDLPPIVIGSHIDTVTGGGRFDGIAGVIGGLEVIRILKESGIQLNHPLEVIDFTAEEPSEYGISTIGSRGQVGNLTNDMLERKDPNGQMLRDGIQYVGGRPDDIKGEARNNGEIALYLEMHIEQGPVLEQMENTIGIVTGIAGIQRYRVNVVGQPGHAGTTPMNIRKDALTTASELNLLLERICIEEWEEDVVGTIGRFHVKPNASNVIPGEVNLDIDVRSLSTNTMDEVITKFKQEAERVSYERGLEVEFDCLSKSSPIKVDRELINLVNNSGQKSANTYMLPSGAGHDANQMANIGPIAMIFIPSKDGKSHCPEEWTDYKDIGLGVNCMVESVIQFDSL